MLNRVMHPDRLRQPRMLLLACLVAVLPQSFTGVYAVTKPPFRHKHILEIPFLVLGTQKVLMVQLPGVS